MSHRAKNSGQMWDGPSSSCLGWALLWMKSKGPRECLARFSPFTWGKWFLQASWELSEMYHGLVWVFRGRWETILLAGFMQLHSCQPLGSRSRGVSHWIAPFFPFPPCSVCSGLVPPKRSRGKPALSRVPFLESVNGDSDYSGSGEEQCTDGFGGGDGPSGEPALWSA